VFTDEEGYEVPEFYILEGGFGLVALYPPGPDAMALLFLFMLLIYKSLWLNR